MTKITRVGVDLAKEVFQVHAVDEREQVCWRARLKRSRWLAELERRVPRGALIGMEACSGAHYWAQQLQGRGYEVRLVAPQYVKPYVKTNKHDAADAEAICEAISRPGMRFVAVKSFEQLDVQAVHRVRSALVGDRTAKANQIRALVGERGLVAPRELRALRAAIPQWLEDAENGLSGAFRALLWGLYEDLQGLDERVRQMDEQIAAHGREHEPVRRLQQICGIGPLSASALYAYAGTARQYGSGRQFAVALGLTPRQASSGGRERLFGISKRGDRYVRALLVHGARAALRHAGGKSDRVSRWAVALAKRSHPNVAAVALAGKLARIVWAMLAHGGDYDAEHGLSGMAVST